MTDSVPSEVCAWAYTAEPYSTMVDSTGQRWRRGETVEGPTDENSRLGRAVAEAVAANELQKPVFSRIKLERVND